MQLKALVPIKSFRRVIFTYQGWLVRILQCLLLNQEHFRKNASFHHSLPKKQITILYSFPLSVTTYIQNNNGSTVVLSKRVGRGEVSSHHVIQWEELRNRILQSSLLKQPLTLRNGTMCEPLDSSVLNFSFFKGIMITALDYLRDFISKSNKRVNVKCSWGPQKEEKLNCKFKDGLLTRMDAVYLFGKRNCCGKLEKTYFIP